jgi:hypothetical protein
MLKVKIKKKLNSLDQYITQQKKKYEAQFPKQFNIER